MNKLPSRKKYQNCFSKNHLSLEQRKKYRDYRYQLCISLDLTSHIPTYTSLKISTYQNRDNEKPDNEVVIVSKYLSREEKAEVKDSIKPEKLDCIDDRKHFGELLFILTAKLKYDLLKNKRTKEDNSGFLHTEDIEKMNPKGPKSDYPPKTKVGKTVCGTLRKFCNGTDKKLRTFVNDLSFEPEQLFHLICYLGITTTRTEVLFWWLNVSVEDVSFKCSTNGKPISNAKLKNEFGKLFNGCLLDDKTLSNMVRGAEADISDQNLEAEQRQTLPSSMQARKTLEPLYKRSPIKKDFKGGGRVFCADMTKLISADSLVTSLGHSLTSAAPLRDPEAKQDFEMLVTLISNDTLIYIKEPEKFPKKPTSIMEAWKKVAENCAMTGCVPAARHTEELGPLSNEKICERMVNPFEYYLDQHGACERLVAWARFQLCDPKLSKVFWENNSKGDLKMVIAMFENARKKPPDKFYIVVDDGGVNMCDMSAQHFVNSELTLQQFTFAYAFWAFVKGYKYSSSLTNEHLYVVHWLRELAIETDASRVSIDEECMPDMVPWGLLITDLLIKDSKHCDTTAIADGILSLRKFTIENWDSAQNYGEQVVFLEEGVNQFMSKVLMTSKSHSNPIIISEKIFKYINPVTDKLPLILKGGKFVVEKVTLNYPTERQVKLLKKNANEHSRASCERFKT